MDILSIEQLKIATTIGVLDWERQIKQMLYFDLDFAVDAASVASIDSIENGLDYAKVSTALQEFVEQNKFFLIETLAEKAAAFLLSTFKLTWLRLKLTKPGIIHNAKNVAITIERGSMVTT
jgi:dihydroneopterin aldolase